MSKLQAARLELRRGLEAPPALRRFDSGWISNVLGLVFGLAGLVTIVMFLSVVAQGEEAGGPTTGQAFKTVTNSSSSSEEFIKAIKLLDSVAGESRVWSQLAGNKLYAPDRRRRFAKHLFDHFVAQGMTLGQVEDVIGNNSAWVSFKRAQKVQREGTFGWIPPSLTQGESGFILPVLADMKGDYHLAIFVSLEENVELKDVITALTAKTKDNLAVKAKIAACETWDSEDEENHMPGSKYDPWPYEKR
jgi:hypothetical protein